MTSPAPVGPWLLAGEAADRARCGRGTIIAALNDGSLVGQQRREGGTWRIHVDDLDAWVRGEPPATTGRAWRAS